MLGNRLNVKTFRWAEGWREQSGERMGPVRPQLQIGPAGLAGEDSRHRAARGRRMLLAMGNGVGRKRWMRNVDQFRITRRTSAVVCGRSVDGIENSFRLIVSRNCCSQSARSWSKQLRLIWPGSAIAKMMPKKRCGPIASAGNAAD